jgi:ABC-type transport system involved in multi-copper enzyme maturation permease subunit
MQPSAGSLVRAEWNKIAGNRMVTLFMIWIFPVAAAAGAVGLCVLALASPMGRTLFRSGALVIELWTQIIPEIWNLPNSWLGRMLLVGFAAFVFAGEYLWHTWKNLLPRNRRTALILAKFVVVAAFVLLAFLSATAILSLGMGLAMGLAGGTPASLPGDRLVGLVTDSALQAVVTLLSTTIAAGYAALAGMYTRSILGGVLVGLGATGGEQFLLMALAQIAGWLREPRVLGLYRLTPSYNVANAVSWINDSSPTAMLFGLAADSLATSLMLLVGWVLALILLTVLLFRRQDIVT